MSEVEPVFGCQHKDCATEVSYPADMLRIWHGKPICEFCFDDLPMIDRQKGDDEDDWIRWSDLDPFVPEHVRALEALTAERDKMEELLRELDGAEKGWAAEILANYRGIRRKALALLVTLKDTSQ